MIFQNLSYKLDKIKLQLFALNYLAQKHNSILYEPGKEHPVIFGMEQLLDRHKRHILRSIYHAENFINKIQSYAPKIQHYPNEKGTVYFVNDFDETATFDFDSFIATLSTLFEEPFKQDTQTVFSKRNFKDFENLFPSKKDADSLVWRVTILRNRVVHPDQGTYNLSGGRFMEFSSKSNAQVTGRKLILKSTLIDVFFDNQAKSILKNYIIPETVRLKKEYKEAKNRGDKPCPPNYPNFHKTAFNAGKKPKKEHSYFYVEGCDLIETFESVLLQVIDYIEQVNQVYHKEFKDLLGDVFDGGILFTVSQKGQVFGWIEQGNHYTVGQGNFDVSNFCSPNEQIKLSSIL